MPTTLSQLLSLLIVVSFLAVPVSLTAQTEEPDFFREYLESFIDSPEEINEIMQEQELLAQEYIQSRSQCLLHYNFGGVAFHLENNPETMSSLQAGHVMTINGTIHNQNDYPLPQGHIVAQVLRHDDSVADENWHPIIDQVTLSEEYGLKANEEASFSFDWIVPAFAPEGDYRVEFSYLVNGRYPISGLPYITNFPGASNIFSVEQPLQTSALNFDRSSVTLNNSPFALRSVPATLSSSDPVAISVDLEALGTQDIPATVTASLYSWSNTDQQRPIEETTDSVTLSAGESTTILFTWDDPQPGSYELVITARPDSSTVLPSIIKVRFPVEGNVPRIIYSGIGGYEDDEAIVVTCATNSTFGDDGGTISTAVSANGREIASHADSLGGFALGASFTRVPIASLLRGDVAVSAEVRNVEGELTDKHSISYEDSLFDDKREERSFIPGLSGSIFNAKNILIVIILIAAAAGIATAISKRKKSNL